MPLSWTDTQAPPDFSDPNLEFRLNILNRFTDADQSFAGEPWWLALIEPAALEEGQDQSPDTNVGQADLPGNGAEKEGAPGEDIEFNSLERILELAERQELAGQILVPGEYDGDDRKATHRARFTVLVQRAYMLAANSPGGLTVLGLNRIIPVTPLPADTVADVDEPFVQADEPVKVPDDSVVIAVIDNGICIGHDLFRRRSGTGDLDLSRVDFFWNMDARTDPAAPVQTTIGRIFTRKEIEAALKDNIRNGLLDEAAFYARTELINWDRARYSACAQRVSHGTHVTALAAGYDPDDPEGARRRIIAVQLPTGAVAQPNGSDLGGPLVDGLNFLKNRLLQYSMGGDGPPPPMVINFSFGNFAGPHDGSGLVEKEIDGRLSSFGDGSASLPLLTLPSGNGNLSRCHAVMRLEDAGPVADRLSWRLQPEDNSLSVIETWLPVALSVPDGLVTLEVRAPGVSGAAVVSAGNLLNISLAVDAQGTPVALVAYEPPAPPIFRGRFTVWAAPTAHPTVPGPYAPSGSWSLAFVKEKGLAPDSVELQTWIQRDETLPGFPEFGRQSYLEDAAYRRFKRPGGRPMQEDPANAMGRVRRAGSISGMACGDLPAVIAGYVRSTGVMADYSAGGPTGNPVRALGPDASAASDDSVVMAGVLSAGSASGSMVPLRGTSVAAPRVARWAAAKLAAGETVDRTTVFQAAEAADPPGGGKPPGDRTGGGRMWLPPVFGRNR